MYFEKVQDKMHVQLTYFEFEDSQAHTYTFLGYFSDSWPDLCMVYTIKTAFFILEFFIISLRKIHILSIKLIKMEL